MVENHIDTSTLIELLWGSFCPNSEEKGTFLSQSPQASYDGLGVRRDGNPSTLPLSVGKGYRRGVSKAMLPTLSLQSAAPVLLGRFVVLKL